MLKKIDKYDRYKKVLKPNCEFYGLGIENECYLMYEDFVTVLGYDIKNKKDPTPHCVNYYDYYKKSVLEECYKNIKDDDKFQIPLFINSYSLGYGPDKSVIIKLLDNSDVLKSMCMNEFMFDCDTIEVITQKFVNTTVIDCVTELIEIKKIILSEIKRIISNKIKFQDANYGFVKYVSNMNNISICNNGTYHIHLTLPTKLDSKCEIKDFDLFKNKHSNAIRSIQLIEPLLVACYSPPDIFSKYNDKFSKCSARLALSRMIGLGTYDTKLMRTGKLDYDSKHNSWFIKFHKESGYEVPKLLGYDFNFNKYKNHGIEIRFFDYFPEKYLYDVINIIVLVCSISLENEICNPIELECWHDLMCNVMKYGTDTKIEKEYITNVTNNFKITCDMKENNPKYVLQEIINNTYNKKKHPWINQISPNMIKPKVI